MGVSLIIHAAKRAVYFIIVLWAVYTLAFALLYVLPSDPIALLLERRSSGTAAPTSEQIEVLRHRYSLDAPLWLRYLNGLGHLLVGDLGRSLQTEQPVGDLLLAVAPNTLTLASAALMIAIPLSLGLGIATSWRRDSIAHRVLVNLPALITAIPGFWLGLLLIQVFSFHLRWAPSSGGSGLGGIVLPALCLALSVSGVLIAVLVRSIDRVLDAPFVSLLEARGLPWRRVYLVHVVRNALLPFTTLAGLTVGTVLVGTVITETVFSRAGLGRLLVASIEAQDAPVVLAIALLAALVFTAVNFIVDLIYPFLDPRLRERVGAVCP